MRAIRSEMRAMLLSASPDGLQHAASLLRTQGYEVLRCSDASVCRRALPILLPSVLFIARTAREWAAELMLLKKEAWADGVPVVMLETNLSASAGMQSSARKRLIPTPARQPLRILFPGTPHRFRKK